MKEYDQKTKQQESLNKLESSSKAPIIKSKDSPEFIALQEELKRKALKLAQEDLDRAYRMIEDPNCEPWVEDTSRSLRRALQLVQGKDFDRLIRLIGEIEHSWWNEGTLDEWEAKYGKQDSI